MNSKFLLLMVTFCITACSTSPVIGERVVSTAPAPSPTAAIEAPVLYRADAGRQGVYDEPAMRAINGVKWQKSFDEDFVFPSLCRGDVIPRNVQREAVGARSGLWGRTLVVHRGRRSNSCRRCIGWVRLLWGGRERLLRRRRTDWKVRLVL